MKYNIALIKILASIFGFNDEKLSTEKIRKGLDISCKIDNQTIYRWRISREL